MELREAQDVIRGGAAFGDVYPLLDELNQEALRHWFVTTSGVPAKPQHQTAAKPIRTGVAVGGLPVATGDLCKKCGGLLVRTGTCMTCQGCGDNQGCG